MGATPEPCFPAVSSATHPASDAGVETEEGKHNKVFCESKLYLQPKQPEALRGTSPPDPREFNGSMRQNRKEGLIVTSASLRQETQIKHSQLAQVSGAEEGYLDSSFGAGRLLARAG